LAEIIIHDLKFKDGIVTNYVEVSKNLKKFIKHPKMFVEYDASIHADESVLNIPLIVTVLPLAWISGSDLIVDTLDKRFKESMDTIQKIFKNMLPLAPFTTEIHVEEFVENRINPEDSARSTGLLFSGGIDSTYSMITHFHEKPRLVMHWGIEGPPYPIYREYWEMVYNTYKTYAEKNDLSYNLTKTNALEILYPRKIEHHFHKELYYGSLWVRLQESLIILGLAAPLSINRFDKLLIAASTYKEDSAYTDVNRPQSARPEIDERISWADLKVTHDGFIPRIGKTKILAKHLRDNELTFRVCLARPGDQTTPEKMNCNNCSKCYRTIMQLTQSETDPNNCGFIVDESTFTKIKEYYINHGLDIFGIHSQKEIPDIIEYDLYGSREFFMWLRDFHKPHERDVWCYRELYDSLPYPLAKILNEIYKKLKINIHFGNPHLSQQRVIKLKNPK